MHAADIAIQSSGRGVVHLAWLDPSGNVVWTRSDDAALTWSTPGFTSVPDADLTHGISLAVYQKQQFIAVATTTGYRVFRNHNAGDGPLEAVDIAASVGNAAVISYSSGSAVKAAVLQF